ncbi:zinc finger, CCHC-type containing protein [Tanacetum coccineum]
MKPTTLFLISVFLFLFTSPSLSTSIPIVDDDIVLDEIGNPLLKDVDYIISPPVSGPIGGTVKLATPLNNQTCEADVVQDPFELYIGTLFTFTPVNHSEEFVKLGSPLAIQSPTENPCEKSIMTTSVGNNSVFRSFFEKQKLTGPNFIDWYRQLRLVLSTEDKENYLEHPIPAAPVAQPGHAYDMLQELKAMFSKQAEQELLQTVREFHTCKQEEGQSVSSHRLGQPVGQNLAVSLILVSLNKDFASFVQNFNMHGMGKTVNELHAMLKLHEETLPKKDANPALLAIRAGRVQKNQKNKPHKASKGNQGKGKNKMGYAQNNVINRYLDKRHGIWTWNAEGQDKSKAVTACTPTV